jgi:hypothetical protein
VTGQCRPTPLWLAGARQGPPGGEDSYSGGFSCKTLEGRNSARFGHIITRQFRGLVAILPTRVGSSYVGHAVMGRVAVGRLVRFGHTCARSADGPPRLSRAVN